MANTVTIEQAARITHSTVSSIRQWIKEGLIPAKCRGYGKPVQFDARALLAIWVRRNLIRLSIPLDTQRLVLSYIASTDWADTMEACEAGRCMLLCDGEDVTLAKPGTAVRPSEGAVMLVQICLTPVAGWMEQFARGEKPLAATINPPKEIAEKMRSTN